MTKGTTVLAIITNVLNTYFYDFEEESQKSCNSEELLLEARSYPSLYFSIKNM